MNKILFQISKENEDKFSCAPRYQDPKLKTIKYKPVLTLNSKPCDSFLQDIRKGTISNITLIKETIDDINIPDSHKIIRPKDCKESAFLEGGFDLPLEGAIPRTYIICNDN